MEEKELLQIIEDAAKVGATQLDLSNKEITLLPSEIGKLHKLETLSVKRNQLNALPPEIRGPRKSD